MSPQTTPNAPDNGSADLAVDRPSDTQRRKRVLLLTHRFPYPPNRGDRIRSYNLMRVLAESFDVTLACPHDEPVSDAELRHVNEICHSVITEPVGKSRWLRAGGSLLGGNSLTEGLFRHPSISEQILSLQQQRPFDAALVFCSSMFSYVDHDAFDDTPTIVDLVDVDSEKWRQLALDNAFPKNSIYNLEYKRVRALEQRIANRADAITLVSDDEAQLFRSLVPTSPPVLGVSNGVDTDYFRPRSSSNPPWQGGSSAARGGSNKEKLTTTQLIFTGVLDYPPNVEGMRWFCQEILPEIRTRLDAQLNIVGRRPSQTVQGLAAIEGVNLIGEVPDVRPYLHAADIAISPLKLARGIQNKVLEAMACGLPVITTTQSAEGIDAIDGKELLIADEIESWVNSICHLADNADLRSKLGRSARKLVVDGYAWSARLKSINELLHQHLSTAM